MIPVDQYKTLREKLDELLIEYDIPKEHFHDSGWLNANIKNYFLYDLHLASDEVIDEVLLEKRRKRVYDNLELALIYIHKLCPYPLTRLYEDINYDRILN